MRKLIAMVVLVAALLGGLASMAGASAIPAKDLAFKTVWTFGEYGNDHVDDCSLTAAADIVQLWDKHRNPIRSPQIVPDYYRITGGVDDGVGTPDAFNLWETQGILGNKIKSATLLTSDQATVDAGIFANGALYAVLDIPQGPAGSVNPLGVPINVMFPTGMTVSPWTTANTIMGGATMYHAVAVVGYSSKYVYLVTWGSVQPVTWAWWYAHAYSVWQINR